MKKTKIEWCDYTINPVKGLCPVGCSYCYARAMYKRFKWQGRVTWYPEAWDLVDTLKKPSRIFIGSTFELFLDTLPENWMEYNLSTAKKYPQHTFIFLTKQPQNLLKWSPFPDNCWVGVSAPDMKMFARACNYLSDIEASVKFLSIEPFLAWDDDGFQLCRLQASGVKWLIIGSLTQPVKHPPIEWVNEIIFFADKASIPVFIKEPLASHYGINRKEYPRVSDEQAVRGKLVWTVLDAGVARK